MKVWRTVSVQGEDGQSPVGGGGVNENTSPQPKGQFEFPP